jgi:transposase InsO family protein
VTFRPLGAVDVAHRLADVSADCTEAGPGAGDRRVTPARRRQGGVVKAQRVVRVMGEASWRCQRPRRCVATTDARPGLGHAPPLRRAPLGSAPPQAWVAESPASRRPPTGGDLAASREAGARRGGGWALARTIATEWTLVAVARAIAARRPAAGRLHHADHGGQSASTPYLERLAPIGAQRSLAASGHGDAHAVAERVFATRHRAAGDRHDEHPVAAAAPHRERCRADVSHHQRLSSRLGDRPPQRVRRVRDRRTRARRLLGRTGLPLVGAGPVIGVHLTSPQRDRVVDASRRQCALDARRNA